MFRKDSQSNLRDTRRNSVLDLKNKYCFLNLVTFANNFVTFVVKKSNKEPQIHQLLNQCTCG